MQVHPFKDQQAFISKEYLTLDLECEEDILNIQNEKNKTKQPETINNFLLAEIALHTHTTKNNNPDPLVCRLSCCTVVELPFMMHMFSQAICTCYQMFAAFVEITAFQLY